MSKEQATKLTLQDLINKKLQRESTEVKFKEIYASKIDGNLVFKVPTEDEAYEYVDELEEDRSTKAIKIIYKKMIYNCCEILHNKELHEAYEIKDPIDIIDIMFKTKDILSIGNILIQESGVSEKEEKVKN